MDVDDDRAFAGELCRIRLVKESADLLGVEAVPADELRVGELLRIQAGGFRFGLNAGRRAKTRCPSVRLARSHRARLSRDAAPSL